MNNTFPFTLQFLALSCAFLHCKKDTASAALFEKIPSSNSGIKFENRVENTADFNIFSYRNFYNGGGVAIGDLNNDGLADVYLTSNMDDNKLFLNRGNFKFEDITEKAGVKGTRFWSTGVVMVDINADGLLDIYVCNAGYKPGEKPENELFINTGIQNGIPVFVEKAAEYGLNEDGYTTHAAFFDYDLDGDLDCYILNNSFMPVNTLNFSNNRELYAKDWPVKDFLKGGGDKLLRNDAGKFVDVTREAGIYGSLIGFGLGITVGDVNGDNWPDMWVSNDFYERDYLYINQKNGTFKEEIEQWVSHLSLASMGTDMADINNDGYPEIFTTEMLPSDEKRLKTSTQFDNFNAFSLKQERGFYPQFMQNSLQLNNKNGTFSEIASYAGVNASDWSWGALLSDFDNDGLRDIYICNGIYKDVIDQDFIDFFADEVIQRMALTGKKEEINEIINKMPSVAVPNKAFRNMGNLKFDDAGKAWGLDIPSFSNGAAYGDLDNDGDLDLVVNNVNQEAFLFKNNSHGKHSVSIQCIGKDQNTFAIGAKIYLFRQGEVLSAQLIPSRGFQSSVDYKTVIGLGDNTVIDSLKVIWPDMRQTLLPYPPADTLLQIHWKDAQGLWSPAANVAPVQAFFEAKTEDFEAHKEDNFADFYQEGLVFRMLSREGPDAAVADINGDGRDDVFIGGASGQPGQLYAQTASGTFTRVEKTTFVADSTYEDTGAVFFDADGDGDADLAVAAGGNHQPVNSKYLYTRLYRNDGKGHFALAPKAIPYSSFNTAVLVPVDIDGDGDLDLFSGSRSIPGEYGTAPKHYIFQNDGKGQFTDVTKVACPELAKFGMVTDAVLANVTGDAQPELVLVGDWRSPAIFDIKGGKFTAVTSNLSQYSGWWNAVKSADLDGDGDLDLVLANRGENFYFTGSAENPAKLWVGDMDQNGIVEKIATRRINGKDLPLALKKELTTHVPGLKKQNLKHVDYAGKSIQELFSEKILSKATVWEGNYFKSAVALNDGQGNFTLKPLPKEVQFSCAEAIWCGDINGDGKPDLVMAGNETGFLPQFSRLDASFGDVLLNKGQGDFEWVENRLSGLTIKGEARAIVPLGIKGTVNLLVTRNNQKPLLYALKTGKMQ